MFFLDLDASFPVEDVLSPHILHKVSIPSAIASKIIKPIEPYWPGALFATTNSVYVLGGDVTSSDTFAVYNTTSHSWATVPISAYDHENSNDIGCSVSDSSTGLAFSVKSPIKEVRK